MATTYPCRTAWARGRHELVKSWLNARHGKKVGKRKHKIVNRRMPMIELSFVKADPINQAAIYRLYLRRWSQHARRVRAKLPPIDGE
jgi:hypothetical protein